MFAQPTPSLSLFYSFLAGLSQWLKFPFHLFCTFTLRTPPPHRPGKASKIRAHKPRFYSFAGFAGELCNFEYNECESNPCQNAGECIDHIGSFECRCTKGYTGNRCQIKVSAKSNDRRQLARTFESRILG